ncbi:MAG: hypothetical protein KJ042_01700 [Deltaproteobacteria bacterium]|nr:hypothetical protein [Deltaproteobacteria bacterium]
MTAPSEPATGWTIRQTGGATLPEDVRANSRDAVRVGLDAVGIPLDLPTQMGLEADDELTAGEVAQVGVHLSCVADLDEILSDLDHTRIEVAFGGAPTAPIVYAAFLRYTRSRGIARETLRGVFAGDILNEYVAYGTFIYPPAAALRLACDMIAFSLRETPGIVPLTVSGFHAREAGCTAAQEIGIALAFAEQYALALRKKGVEPSEAASAMAILMNATPDLPGEIAKFRALRGAWSTAMRTAFGAELPLPRLHVRTSAAAYTGSQPELNIVRGNLAALAAAIGGAHTIAIAPFDATSGLPSAFAQQIAIQTQRVLAVEAHATELRAMVDSEETTRRAAAIEMDALAVVEKIRGWGGALAAIESGRLQRFVGEAADAHFAQLDSGRFAKVGETAFAEAISNDRIPTPRTKVDPAAARELHVARLREHVARRDAAACQAAIDAVVAAAKSPAADLMPPIIAAVEAEATIAEVAQAPKSVFGGFGDEMAGI